MAELLIGCGNGREKHVRWREGGDYPAPLLKEWVSLTTLDIDPNCGADIEHDLNRLPLPFKGEDIFDEIHAYSVLEHVGQQGDWRFFFAQFSEFWRILKPNGLLCGCVPNIASPWLWGDPGHTRALPPQAFTYLNQPSYTRQIGVTFLCDYRHVYEADFDQWEPAFTDHEHWFVLQAIKPSRIVK